MKRRNYEPKSPRILHATKDKHQLVRTAEPDIAKAKETVWRPERSKFKRSGACTKGQWTTYLYLSNTWEVGHESRYPEGVVWQWRERGVYSRVLAQASLGKCPAEMAFNPKEVSMGWDHLMYVIKVGDEVA